MAALHSSDWRRTPAGRRAVSLVLAILIHILLLLLLLRLAPPVTIRPPADRATTIFTVPAPTTEQASKHSHQKQRTKQAASAAPRAPVARPARAPTPANPSAQPWVLNPALAGFDLSHVPTAPASQIAGTGVGTGEGTGSGAGSSKGAGQGPGGVQLYAAQWVREPTNAEMGPYMPAGHYAGGWADIACRTVPRFHVEDCEELGQSPPGSGLSRALREAAFQFLVRPPRVNGKTMVGEWVRIHFDFYERKRGEDAPTGQ